MTLAHDTISETTKTVPRRGPQPSFFLGALSFGSGGTFGDDVLATGRAIHLGGARKGKGAETIGESEQGCAVVF